MTEEFLPEDYSPKESTGGYMRLKQGDNVFRILQKPIIGTSWWVQEMKDGKAVRRPRRIPRGQDIMVAEVPVDEVPKEFWAMVVWNYADKQVQILEVTQKSIVKELFKIISNPKWGSPRHYDIVINRDGEDLGTKYTVTPDPKEPVDPKIIEEYEKMTINLEALFENGDPFGNKVTATDVTDIMDA